MTERKLEASVTHSPVLLPSLMGSFPIKFCQKSDQDPVILGWKLKFVLKFTMRRSHSADYCYRLRADSATTRTAKKSNYYPQ